MKTHFYAIALLIFPFVFPQHDLRAQTPEKSLLWKISGNGLPAPSYLYGTMHVGDKRAFKFTKSMMPSFEACKGFAMELDPEKAKADPMKILNMMKLEEGKTLESMFEPADWKMLDAHFTEKMGGSVTQFNDYSPFFIYSMMLQGQFKNQMGEALDLHLYGKAKASGKDLFGLETIEEQVNAINRMPIDKQTKMIMDVVNGVESGGKKDMRKMLKYYSKGDLQKLLEISEEADLGNDFETALITERNEKMADRMVPLIKEQATFVAVGALHLPGEDGVIQLLRNKGYMVEALK